MGDSSHEPPSPVRPLPTAARRTSDSFRLGWPPPRPAILALLYRAAWAADFDVITLWAAGLLGAVGRWSAAMAWRGVAGPWCLSKGRALQNSVLSQYTSGA